MDLRTTKTTPSGFSRKYKEFGLDAHIETFDVLFPTPEERVVELVKGGPEFKAKLQEPPVKVDPTSDQTAEQLPTYNAYSIDGDVTAPLVYVNFGVPADYDELERMGVSVKGAIVIARYYGSWRGIKPKVAAEHGAIGCLIFSDPHEDGYFQGDVFPEGPYRPKDGVQRGSVADMPLYSGDPLTPGVGATKDAKRLELKDAQTITKIPVLPISYADAEPLLASLKGPMSPDGMARRTRHQLSRRPWPRRRTPESEVEVVSVEDHLRHHRENSRFGLSRRVGDSRQPSRRLGKRRRGSALRPVRDARRSALAGGFG